jgi:hypothetical protein
MSKIIEEEEAQYKFSKKGKKKKKKKKRNRKELTPMQLRYKIDKEYWKYLQI